MVNQIRASVFETNSSSVHSICISKSFSKYCYTATLYAKTGSFNWEHRIYIDPEDKLSYLWTAVYCYANAKTGESHDIVLHSQIVKKWEKLINDELSKYEIKVCFVYSAPYSFTECNIDHDE